jgi:hypothetical protein
LQRRLKPEDAEALAEKLSTGTWTHDYPIFASIAKELGLSVNTDMPNEVLELIKLYPQPVRGRAAAVSNTCRFRDERKPPNDNPVLARHEQISSTMHPRADVTRAWRTSHSGHHNRPKPSQAPSKAVAR